jgi:hypothetical protein
MTSAINEIDMEFEEIKNVNIETIGSLSQSTRPCPIKYKSISTSRKFESSLGGSKLNINYLNSTSILKIN